MKPLLRTSNSSVSLFSPNAKKCPHVRTHNSGQTFVYKLLMGWLRPSSLEIAQAYYVIKFWNKLVNPNRLLQLHQCCVWSENSWNYCQHTDVSKELVRSTPCYHEKRSFFVSSSASQRPFLAFWNLGCYKLQWWAHRDYVNTFMWSRSKQKQSIHRHIHTCINKQYVLFSFRPIIVAQKFPYAAEEVCQTLSSSPFCMSRFNRSKRDLSNRLPGKDSCTVEKRGMLATVLLSCSTRVSHSATAYRTFILF